MIYRKGKNIPNEIKNKYDYYGRCSDNKGNKYVFWTNNKNEYKKLKDGKKSRVIHIFMKMKMTKGIENYRAQVIKRLEKDE